MNNNENQVHIYLVRHGSHQDVGKILSGRTRDLSLSSAGEAEVTDLANFLAGGGITHLFSSPRQRTLETARPIARIFELTVEVDEALDEVDFGDWSGRPFADLDPDPLWQAWNVRRASACAPGGETMADAVRRAVDFIERQVEARPGGTMVCVTHCDIIRGVLAHYLGLCLDHILRFDVDPASLSRLIFEDGVARVGSVNERPGRPPARRAAV